MFVVRAGSAAVAAAAAPMATAGADIAGSAAAAAAAPPPPPLLPQPPTARYACFLLPPHTQELTVDRDRSSLFHVARALHGLQQEWGAVPHVKGVGDAAAAVQRLLARMRAEQGRDAPAPGAPRALWSGGRPGMVPGCQLWAHLPRCWLLHAEPRLTADPPELAMPLLLPQAPMA